MGGVICPYGVSRVVRGPRPAMARKVKAAGERGTSEMVLTIFALKMAQGKARIWP